MSRYVLSLFPLLLLLVPAEAQTTLYSVNGFEQPGYNPGTFVPQQNWQTTDLNQGSTPAGVIQNAVFFEGNQAMQVIGPNLANDIGFSYQTFWYHDSTSLPGLLPYNPVANGTPIIRISWRQYLDGVFNQVGQMPFAGVFVEGLTAGNTQGQITSVLLRNDGRISVVTTGGATPTTPVDPVNDPLRFNRWLHFELNLDFNTQRFSLWQDGVMRFNSIAFRNTFGSQNRLAEFGFQASAIDLISPPPTNNVYYDNFTVTALPVPEPTTWVLLSVAAAGGLGWQWQSRGLRSLVRRRRSA